MPGKELTTCLWFDTQGEAAATFYTSIFPGSRLGRISRYTDVGPGPEGSVMVIEFELCGKPFVALNGGPAFTFTEAISIQIPCADQDEINYYWDRLSDGGQEVACGWLKDKFGLSWQVVPEVLAAMVSDPDPEKAARVTKAFMAMTKFSIADLEQAYAGT